MVFSLGGDVSLYSELILCPCFPNIAITLQISWVWSAASRPSSHPDRPWVAPCQGQLRGGAVVESQRGDGHPLFITKLNNPQQNWSRLVWPNGWGMDGMVRGAREEGFQGGGWRIWCFFFFFYFSKIFWGGWKGEANSLWEVGGGSLRIRCKYVFDSFHSLGVPFCLYSYWVQSLQTIPSTAGMRVGHRGGRGFLSPKWDVPWPRSGAGPAQTLTECETEGWAGDDLHRALFHKSTDPSSFEHKFLHWSRQSSSASFRRNTTFTFPSTVWGLSWGGCCVSTHTPKAKTSSSIKSANSSTNDSLLLTYTSLDCFEKKLSSKIIFFTWVNWWWRTTDVSQRH